MTLKFLRSEKKQASMADINCSTSLYDVSGGLSTKDQANASSQALVSIRLQTATKKWSILRSKEQFVTLHSNLEKEFHMVSEIPPLPPFPTTAEEMPALNAFLQSLLADPSIKTSPSVKEFINNQDKQEVTNVPQTRNDTKKGVLTYGSGRGTTFTAVIENRVLRCMNHHGICAVAVLLDGCTVSTDGDRAFVLHIENTSSRKKPKFALIVFSDPESPDRYRFVAESTKERDEWVEVIRTSHKTLQDSTSKVSGQLRVVVVGGRKLAAKDFRLIGSNTSDPYAILRIEHQQNRTRTIYKTLEPEWNEEFSFEITQNQGMLYVLIYDEDLLTSSDSMGQIVFPLSGIPRDRTLDVWLPVLPREPHENISGEIRLKLSYEFVKDEEVIVETVDPVFGANLQEICSNPNLCVHGIPKFFRFLLYYLEENAMNEPGIFRISGSFSSIKSLKLEFDQGKEVDMTKYDVHSAAGAIKLYLRELPVPLLTFENYNKLVEVSSISSEKELLIQLKQIMQVLPPAHHDMLKFMFPVLKRFAENHKVNMMDTNNLAIVFGPSLARPKVDTFDTAMHTVNITHIVALLISHFDEIFK